VVVGLHHVLLDSIVVVAFVIVDGHLVGSEEHKCQGDDNHECHGTDV
jgi:hypothetical protein